MDEKDRLYFESEEDEALTDEACFVCIEYKRYETLIDKEYAYEAAIKAIRDFVDEDNFLRFAKENGYANDNGKMIDYRGLLSFFRDHVSGAVHYYDAMRENRGEKNADCE